MPCSRWRSLHWFIVVLLLPAAHAAAMPALPVLDIGDLQHHLLDGVAEFRIAPADASFDQVRDSAFEPLRPQHINQGISAQTYWLRLRLANPADTARSWVLHHETSYIDNVTVYAADGDGEFARTALSDRRPFAERPLPYRKLAYAHETPAHGHTDIYLRLNFDKADSVTLRFHLWEREYFHVAVAQENLVYGAYYGIILALMVITLVTALVLRRAVYFYYLAFLAATGLMWALLNGYAYQYLWPRSVFWHNEGFHIVFLLFAMATLQFSKAFLKTAHHFPRIHRWMGIAQLVMLAGIAARLAGAYVPVLVLSFTALGLLILLPLIAWQAYRGGLRYTRWYALAWVVYSLGLVFSVFSAATGVFAWGMEPLAYAQAATLLEAMLLLAALAERLKGWDVDRQHALRLAHQDPLTGLGNRRLLRLALERFKARHVQNGQPVFLLMIDLDHFKAVNDAHGHDAGDAVLRNFALLLKRNSRDQDLCVRLGGEEFAVLFQAPNEQIARRIAERIRSEFANMPTLYEGALISHTLSAGLTRAVAEGGQLDEHAMMMRADAALYQAKARGRNRVAWHLDPDSEPPTPRPPVARRHAGADTSAL